MHLVYLHPSHDLTTFLCVGISLHPIPDIRLHQRWSPSTATRAASTGASRTSTCTHRPRSRCRCDAGPPSSTPKAFHERWGHEHGLGCLLVELAGSLEGHHSPHAMSAVLKPMDHFFFATGVLDASDLGACWGFFQRAVARTPCISHTHTPCASQVRGVTFSEKSIMLCKAALFRYTTGDHRAFWEGGLLLVASVSSMCMASRFQHICCRWLVFMPLGRLFSGHYPCLKTVLRHVIARLQRAFFMWTCFA